MAALPKIGYGNGGSCFTLYPTGDGVSILIQNALAIYSGNDITCQQSLLPFSLLLSPTAQALTVEQTAQLGLGIL